MPSPQCLRVLDRLFGTAHQLEPISHRYHKTASENWRQLLFQEASRQIDTYLPAAPRTTDLIRLKPGCPTVSEKGSIGTLHSTP